MTGNSEPTPLPSLVTMGNPRLSQPSLAVDRLSIATEGFQGRLETLGRAMLAYEGIGIAAPQLGWFERFFVLLAEGPVVEGEEPEGEPVEGEEAVPDLQYWINPEIVSVSAEQCWAWEGCLSVPGLRGWIRRPAAIAVRGRGSRGEALSAEFNRWPARVFQHEFDHLDGILFPYRAADPRHLVMTEQLDRREDWPPDWPAPGAKETPLGEVVYETGPSIRLAGRAKPTGSTPPLNES